MRARSRLPPRNFQFNLLVPIYFNSNAEAALIPTRRQRARAARPLQKSVPWRELSWSAPLFSLPVRVPKTLHVESERLPNQTVLIPMNWEVRCDVSMSTQPRSEPLPSPMIFVGALTKLPGRGRVSGVGAVRACALWPDHPAAGDGRTGRKDASAVFASPAV
jgi:hypothetical protein